MRTPEPGRGPGMPPAGTGVEGTGDHFQPSCTNTDVHGNRTRFDRSDHPRNRTMSSIEATSRRSAELGTALEAALPTSGADATGSRRAGDGGLARILVDQAAAR